MDVDELSATQDCMSELFVSGIHAYRLTVILSGFGCLGVLDNLYLPSIGST